MKQNAPPPNRTIRITTAIYIAITAACFIGAVYQRYLLVPALVLILLGAYCYWFWSPVAYELDGNTLTVRFRGSRSTFPGVTRCSRIQERFSFLTLRLCGNGGVFAGSGIFWNKRMGIFRAYVTRSQPDELVLVESRRGKVVISPEDPAGFLDARETTAMESA